MLAQDLTTGEIPRGALAMFLAEFILRTLDNGTPHCDLFDALWRTTHRIEHEPSIGRIHLSFLVESVVVTGLMPDAPHVAPGGFGRFNLANAEWESGPPMGEDYLSVAEAEHFLRIQGMNFDEVQAETLSHDARNLLVLQHVRYLQLHLSSPRPIRSWEVLSTVLAP